MLHPINPLESDGMPRKPRRLPRVEFEAGALEAAQLKRQLGDQQVAAVLGKSVKTWQRWRRGNYVHEDVAPRVIELLGVQPVSPLWRVASGDDLDRLAALVRALRDAIAVLQAENAQLAERLDRLEPRQGPGADSQA